MQNQGKTLVAWVLVAILAAGAFAAGARLRSHQDDFIGGLDVSVQANALLKLTPEASPVALEDADSKKTAGDERNRELLSSVVRLLKQHYVEPITDVEEAKMARGAVRAMLEALEDPDTRYTDPQERRLLDDAAAGCFHGIGAILALKEEKTGELDVTKIVVIAPMPGSPAQEAGLGPGDSITEIDGKWIVTHDPFQEAAMQSMIEAARNKEIDELTYQKAFEAAEARLKGGLKISEALEMLTARSSGELTLKVDHHGGRESRSLKVQCRDTTVDPVVARYLRHKIAYIGVAQFNQRAAREFDAELRKARSVRARALVLDLRNNPGGTLDVGVQVASKITGGGVLAIIQENNKRRSIRLPKTRGLPMPVAVLVNEGTAGVAELVAGTLRDSGACVIVGSKTFGDGLVQTPLVLRDGSSAIVTTGKMLTAKGVDFHGRGLLPNVQVRQSRRHDDYQLGEAERMLLAKLRGS